MKTGLVEFQPEFWQGNLISLFASSICSPWINLHQNWCIKSSQPTLYWYDLNKFLVSLACDVLHLPFCQMDPNFLSAGTNRNFLRKCGWEFIGRQTTICGKISSISSRCKYTQAAKHIVDQLFISLWGKVEEKVYFAARFEPLASPLCVQSLQIHCTSSKGSKTYQPCSEHYQLCKINTSGWARFQGIHNLSWRVPRGPHELKQNTNNACNIRVYHKNGKKCFIIFFVASTLSYPNLSFK